MAEVITSNNIASKYEILKAMVAVVLISVLSLTACNNETEPGPGYDVSYPQCGLDKLPKARSFAIVGLNDGVPKTLNPCFKKQIEWAIDSAGDTTQPAASIYVTAANPGKAMAKEWPQSGANEIGQCDGQDTQACAFEYGKGLATWNLDTYDREFKDDLGKKAGKFKWWLDVELGTYWQCNTGLSELCGQRNALEVQNGALGRNSAVVKGMVSRYKQSGINVGIYTNPYQWNLIAAQQAEGSILEGVDVWMSGAETRLEAEVNCKKSGFNALGQIILSQYNSDQLMSFDKNVICDEVPEQASVSSSIAR